MAEIDYIKFKKGKAYLDTGKLDECFYALGGSCPGTYERFITRTPEGDHVNLAEIEKAFEAAEKERNRADQVLQEAAEKYKKMEDYFFEADVVQRAFRTPRGIASLRLYHSNYFCEYNWKQVKSDTDEGVRLYFPTQDAYLKFFDDHMEDLSLCPCPKCIKSYHADLTEAIRYDHEYHRMQPDPREYPMDVSWMNAGKEKRAQKRRWMKQPGILEWGGLLNLLFLFVVTLFLTHMIKNCGWGEKLMDFSDEYFGYATGFYPVMLTDRTRIREWEVIGRDMVLSNDAKTAWQGAAWLALSLATAALIVLHFIYNGWSEKKWKTNPLLYPVFLLKGLAAALFAIPFACFTIPWTVFFSTLRTGVVLSALFFPGMMEPLSLNVYGRNKGGGTSNYGAPGSGGSKWMRGLKKAKKGGSSLA